MSYTQKGPGRQHSQGNSKRRFRRARHSQFATPRAIRHRMALRGQL